MINETFSKDYEENVSFMEELTHSFMQELCPCINYARTVFMHKIFLMREMFLAYFMQDHSSCIKEWSSSCIKEWNISRINLTL